MNSTIASSFSRQAWDRNAPVYEAIRALPFNTELAAGVLDRARFIHYITQDAHYLIGFGRALALAAAKAPQPDRIVQFAKAAEVRSLSSARCMVLSLRSSASHPIFSGSCCRTGKMKPAYDLIGEPAIEGLRATREPRLRD
jgi:hypothetical protein